jgi:hypothetical protein
MRNPTREAMSSNQRGIIGQSAKKFGIGGSMMTALDIEEAKVREEQKLAKIAGDANKSKGMSAKEKNDAMNATQNRRFKQYGIAGTYKY